MVLKGFKALVCLKQVVLKANSKDKAIPATSLEGP
jgi:hypothetical protein